MSRTIPATLPLMQSLALLCAIGTSAACADNRTFYEEGAAVEPEFFCSPNGDGQIDRSEFPTQTAVAQRLLRSRSIAIPIAAQALDFRQSYPDDELFEFVASPVDGFWFADQAPSDALVVPLPGQTDLAIVRESAQAIELVALASIAEDQTFLQYSPTVALLQFPLRPSLRRLESRLQGTFLGLPYDGVDSYSIEVGQAISLSLPHLAFQDAYPVRTELRNDPGEAGAAILRQQLSIYSECFGEVLRATSADNTSQDEFTLAQELWRFSL